MTGTAKNGEEFLGDRVAKAFFIDGRKKLYFGTVFDYGDAEDTGEELWWVRYDEDGDVRFSREDYEETFFRDKLQEALALYQDQGPAPDQTQPSVSDEANHANLPESAPEEGTPEASSEASGRESQPFILLGYMLKLNINGN